MIKSYNKMLKIFCRNFAIVDEIIIVIVIIILIIIIVISSTASSSNISMIVIIINNIIIELYCNEHYYNELYCNEHLFHNYQRYPLSPLKPKSLALIEPYLPNIFDPVYSVNQSFMWFLWLNWRKSTFYPATAPNDSECWPIVTSSIQEPVASNCDVTMTDCFRVVAMHAFLAQWCWGQWFNEFVKDMPVPSFSQLSYFLLYLVTPVFQHGASLFIIRSIMRISSIKVLSYSYKYRYCYI